MKAIEFTAELDGSSSLQIPFGVATQLPKQGKARVIVLTDDDDDAAWQAASYEQFLRDDHPEDEIYEALR